MGELTKGQINYFVSEVKRWAIELGMVDWHILVDDQGSYEDYGSCSGDSESRLAVISIANEWDIEPTEKEISRVAFHEVCELLLVDISEIATARTLVEKDLATARHRIIRVLENVLWKPRHSLQ